MKNKKENQVFRQITDQAQGQTEALVSKAMVSKAIASKAFASKLGVTRSLGELTEILVSGAERGICVVPLPLFKYVDVEFVLTSAELAAIDWVCFTSARGVESFFRELARRGDSVSPHTKFAVVGAKTSTALSAHGITAAIQPQTTIGEAMFEEVLMELGRQAAVDAGRIYNIVYVGAEDVRFDPAKLFAGAGVSYRRVVAYRAEGEELSREIAECFAPTDIILFTSPKTAMRYDDLFGAPGARVLAIGEITAEAIEELGWGRPEILTEPNLELAIEFVSQRLQSHNECHKESHKAKAGSNE